MRVMLNVLALAFGLVLVIVSHFIDHICYS